MSPQVEADIETVCDTLALGAPQRDRLTRAVTGHVCGNPNLPVFRLVHMLAQTNIFEHPEAGRRNYVGPESMQKLSLPERALLHFLIEMDSFGHAFDIIDACRDLNPASHENAIREAVRSVVRILRSYRMKYLPAEMHRRSFMEIRSFLSCQESGQAVDGSAMLFWTTRPSTARWRNYKTAVTSVIDYHTSSQERQVVREMLSTNVTEYCREVTFDAAPDPAEYLCGALEVVQNSPLKVFTESEAGRLSALVSLGVQASVWPTTALSYMGLPPVQNRIIQTFRDRGCLTHADLEKGSLERPAPQVVYDGMCQLEDLCQEAIQIAYLVGQRLDKIPDTSKTAEIRKLRQLSRRASFYDRDDDDLWPLLLEITPALTAIQTFLKKVIYQWGECIEKKNDRLMAEWALFDERLKQIYLSGGLND